MPMPTPTPTPAPLRRLGILVLAFLTVLGPLLAQGGLLAPGVDAERRGRQERPHRLERADGHAERDDRIVGGWPSIPGTNRFMTFLLIEGVDPATGQTYTARCGGSLIRANWVLTAAHCLADGPTRVTMAIGINTIPGTGETFEVRQATRYVIHPNYNPATFSHDVALLTFDTAVVTVPPIVVAPEYSTIGLSTAAALTVAGWGTTSEGGQASNQLREANVLYVPDADCSSTAVSPRPNFAVAFCAGRLEGGVDSCQGDSGGPIFLNQGGYATQIGIVSYGVGCARPGLPGVYTKIAGSDISRFIVSITGGGGGGPQPTPVPTAIPTPGPTPPPTPPPGGGDTVPPSVAVAIPSNFAVVKPKFVFSVVASDAGSGVDSVEFWYCTTSCGLLSTLRAAPYTISVKGPPGFYELYAIARDRAGNRAQSASVNIVVQKKKKKSLGEGTAASPGGELGATGRIPRDERGR